MELLREKQKIEANERIRKIVIVFLSQRFDFDFYVLFLLFLVLVFESEVGLLGSTYLRWVFLNLMSLLGLFLDLIRTLKNKFLCSHALMFSLASIFCFSLSNSIEDDVMCLQGVKNSLSDPTNKLSSWTFTNSFVTSIYNLQGFMCWNEKNNRRGSFPVRFQRV